VEIEEVHDIENVMDSEVEVINHESDAKSSDGEDAVSKAHCKKLPSAHTMCDNKGGE